AVRSVGESRSGIAELNKEHRNPAGPHPPGFLFPVPAWAATPGPPGGARTPRADRLGGVARVVVRRDNALAPASEAPILALLAGRRPPRRPLGELEQGPPSRCDLSSLVRPRAATA